MMHRQRHAIRPMPLGRRAQRPQGILQPRTQARETLGKTQRDMLPIGMRQHKVIEQVRKWLAPDGHLQIVHAREIRGRQSARWVLLREKHFLRRATQGLPLPHPPLERPPH
jgi:hypothetical protein